MILVFGSVNVDLVSRVERIARPGETVLSPGYERHFGGKGANQAVAAARMLAPGAGPVVFCSALGTDAFGQECLENLTAEGIDTTPCQIGEGATGCAFISVDRSGENAITVASGANDRIRADRLDASVLDRATIVVLQMEVPWQENAAVARRMRVAGGRTILNFAPARLDVPADALDRFVADVDVLVLNEHEAETLASGLAIETRDAASALCERFGIVVVVTLGARGAKLCEPGGEVWYAPAEAVEVVDTTGAGDTFVGAFAAALDEGCAAREAVERAGIAASLSCTRAGAQGGSPTRAEHDGFTAARRAASSAREG